MGTLKRLPEATKNKWRGMTSDNQHIGVRVAMAEFLTGYMVSFTLYVHLFMSLEQTQSVSPYCDWLANENAVTDNMLHDIEKHFGKDVRDEFMWCLQ